MSTDLRAWMVSSWAPVVPMGASHEPAGWRHASTTIDIPDAAAGVLLQGGTVWTTRGIGGVIAAGWEWIEWQPGIVVLKDPVGIVSNLCLGTQDAESDRLRLLALSQLVHDLPWQAAVLEQLGRRRKGSGRAAAQRPGLRIEQRLAA